MNLAPSSTETEVLIIGGGLVGCAAAYYLAQRGIRSILLERDEINRGGSGTNAGSLHIQVGAAEAAFSDTVLRDMLPLKAAAAAAWSELERELGCDLGVFQRGGLMLAETEAQLEVLHATVEREQQFGLPVEALSPNDLRSLAPNLSRHLAGAAYCGLEGMVNPLRVTPAYARLAQAQGARIWPRTPVRAIRALPAGGFEVTTSTGATVRAARILDAAGAWAGAVARLAGVELSMLGKLIQVSVTERAQPMLSVLVCSVEGGITLKQTPDGMFLIGGGWPATTDPDSGEPVLDRQSVAGNIGLSIRLLPALRTILLQRSWTGPIAQAYDQDGQLLQILGEAPGLPGFYILAGGMLLTLGPLYASLMAELIATGKTSLPVSIHAPARFSHPLNIRGAASLTL